MGTHHTVISGHLKVSEPHVIVRSCSVWPQSLQNKSGRLAENVKRSTRQADGSLSGLGNDTWAVWYLLSPDGAKSVEQFFGNTDDGFLFFHSLR